jgi:hypothetical protein
MKSKNIDLEVNTTVNFAAVYEEMLHQFDYDDWFKLIVDIEDTVCDLDFTKKLRDHLNEVINEANE